MTDPVPPTARIELGRLAGRWHQLPLGQALPHVGAVRELAQRYADRSAQQAGRLPQPLPDLGPAVAMDQLTVTVYDLCQGEPTGADPGRQPPDRRRGVVPVGPELADELALDLAALRRRLG